MSATDQSLMVPAAAPAPSAPAAAAMRNQSPVAAQARAPKQGLRARTDHLTGAQKAAIIVRLLLAEGMDMPIASLPPQTQADLTRTLGEMRLVDRATMCAVVDEFVEMLEQVGLSFPDGLEGALSLLDGKLDARATQSLRALVRGGTADDPWSALEIAETDEILQLLGQESQIVGAVLLSKLSTDKAARILMALPPEQAQTLALAIARTEAIAPETVARIGATLAGQLREKPPRAFDSPPSKRVGEILNASSAAIRDQLLRDIELADQGFASGVRKSIFTFQDIPARLGARDVPAVMRELGGDDLMQVMAAKQPADASTCEFLLENMSKRLAETLREDAQALPQPASDIYEAAVSRISATVRRLADEGAITLAPAAE